MRSSDGIRRGTTPTSSTPAIFASLPSYAARCCVVVVAQHRDVRGRRCRARRVPIQALRAARPRRPRSAAPRRRAIGTPRRYCGSFMQLERLQRRVRATPARDALGAIREVEDLHAGMRRVALHERVQRASVQLVGRQVLGHGIRVEAVQRVPDAGGLIRLDARPADFATSRPLAASAPSRTISAVMRQRGPRA